MLFSRFKYLDQGSSKVIIYCSGTSVKIPISVHCCCYCFHKLYFRPYLSCFFVLVLYCTSFVQLWNVAKPISWSCVVFNCSGFVSVFPGLKHCVNLDVKRYLLNEIALSTAVWMGRICREYLSISSGFWAPKYRVTQTPCGYKTVSNFHILRTKKMWIEKVEIMGVRKIWVTQTRLMNIAQQDKGTRIGSHLNGHTWTLCWRILKVDNRVWRLVICARQACFVPMWMMWHFFSCLDWPNTYPHSRCLYCCRLDELIYLDQLRWHCRLVDDACPIILLKSYTLFWI